jgi:hypothetical protein
MQSMLADQNGCASVYFVGYPAATSHWRVLSSRFSVLSKGLWTEQQGQMLRN